MNILSLDGGGIRGVCTARILERLNEAEPDFLHHVDLIAGTSTGGILALALAAGESFSDCVKLYSEHGRSIFARRDAIDGLTGGLDELIRADFSQEGLRNVLQDVFGDRKLKHLKKPVLIPAFDLLRFRPKFFDVGHDGDRTCVEVALATSAAPTYFPVYKGYCDGGLFANNPSDSAITHALMEGQSQFKLSLLSIGSGAVPYEPPAAILRGDELIDWGHKQWLIDKPHLLLAALLDGGIVAAHKRAEQALGDRYFRVQPALPREIDLADAEQAPLLILTAELVELEPILTWMRSQWVNA